MILDLQAIAGFPAHLVLEEESSRLDIAVTGFTLADRVRVRLNIVQSDNMYYCSGETVCNARMECSRCLDEYSQELCGKLDFIIRERGSEEEIAAQEIPDDELIIPVGSGRVDITNFVRESILLEIPLKPLCVEECRGLCPQCGVNRNEQKCGCRIKRSDPRWDALRDLR